jgi:hypothetical protein
MIESMEEALPNVDAFGLAPNSTEGVSISLA